MDSHPLKILHKPKLTNAKLIMGLTGWLNGGDVSTGTVECLVEELDARTFAKVDSNGFYIYNFPGTMEITSIFRPHIVIEDGIVKELDIPANVFLCCEENNIVFFLGQEPNINWVQYCDCVLDLCSEYNIDEIYFIGSVAGLVPHTRDPRYFVSASDLQLLTKLEKFGLKRNNYNGPASIVNYMLHRAYERKIKMASIIAEIPAYVHGRNPKCIEATAKRISAILGLGIDLYEMRSLGEELEKKLNDIIAEKTELASHIEKLESDYDNEIFNTEMGDLKDWLHKQGIRLD